MLFQYQDTTQATNFGGRLGDSFSHVFTDFLRPLAGAAVILFAGYLVAKLLQRMVERLLRRIHLNQILERGGVLEAVERGGSHPNPSRAVAGFVFWLAMFAVILVASDALGLSSLANVFQELVSYIPSLIAAVIIVLAGIVLGKFVGGLIAASAGGLTGGRMLARIGHGGVILLAVFMAVQELGIATDIVTMAFAILFGAVALALALAFGLGNRALAGEVTRAWYERYRAERDEVRAIGQRAVAAEEAELDREEGSSGG